MDTNLVSYLLGANVKHKSSCNEVVKALNGSDVFAVGIIDADKRMPTIDAGFSEHVPKVAEGASGRHLTMFIHEDGKRFLFTVKPAMDKFIMDAAAECDVRLGTFGFPEDLPAFKRITKTIQAAEDSKLRNLFSGIRESSEFQRLRNTLKYLITKQYDIDVQVVRDFFDGALQSPDLVKYL